MPRRPGASFVVALGASARPEAERHRGVSGVARAEVAAADFEPLGKPAETALSHDHRRAGSDVPSAPAD